MNHKVKKRKIIFYITQQMAPKVMQNATCELFNVMQVGQKVVNQTLPIYMLF